MICLVPATILNGQILHPAGGIVFDDRDVPRIDIDIPVTSLDSLYADPYSNMEYRASFRFTRGSQSEILSDVGIRFRGNTSRNKEKKAFRVSFNTFERGRDFHGIEKMNLNAETNDPSMVRSKLSWKLFRFLGIAGSRSNHVLLYVNGDYHGVYINTEHIDEKFVRSRFGSNDGNLYKCLWPADLSYLGPDQDDYKFEHDGRRAYDLNINEEWDDYQDLADLITVLQQYSGEEFMEEIEKHMNVQQYLKIMAVDVMTGNWDGYIANRNNYYLYRDQNTGRFEYIAYDLDNTFGIDWLGEDWSMRSIYSWHMEERPLYEKILQQESYKAQYTAYIRQLADYMTSDVLAREILRWSTQISSWVQQDPYYPLDWGYDYGDFWDALSMGHPDHFHLPYGVLEYASLRAASALEECIQADAPPLVSHARISPSPGRVEVDWTVEDDQPGFSSTLHYQVNQGGWQSITQGEAAITDSISGQLTFKETLEGLGVEDRVALYLTAKDQGGQETRYPSANQLFVEFPLANGPVLINEFMASNSNTVADSYGEFDDWVEFYNPTGDPVWLGDLYLSDNVGVPGKYKFPDTYLSGDEFFVVWLDGQPEQGNRHAPFKISKEGEQIRLSRRPAEGFAIMDSLSFGPQLRDVALGRSSDGGMDWIVFTQATPGFSNLRTGAGEFLASGPELLLYPNPVTGGILNFNREVSGTVFNGMGIAVLQLSSSMQADVGTLEPGMYIFRTGEGESRRFVVSTGY